MSSGAFSFSGTLEGMSLLVAMLLLAEPVELSSAEVKKAVETFKVRGAWIHPAIVQEFLPWVSDHQRPIVRSMDVAAALETNRYFEEVKEGPKGPKVERGEEGFLDYEWLGRTQSGLHVLVISLNSGGSGVFTSLGVFKVTEAESVDGPGKPYRSLVLSIVRWVSLGDRVVPKLSIKGNVVSGRVECTLPSCASNTLRLSL